MGFVQIYEFSFETNECAEELQNVTIGKNLL